MVMRVLPFPLTPKAGATAPAGDEVAMHQRFEARRLAAFVLGPRPLIKILQVAWLDKQRHINAFLNDYYTRHKTLPDGCHNLGNTAELGLRVGVVDFGRARTQMHRALKDEGRDKRGVHRLLAAILSSTRLNWTLR